MAPAPQDPLGPTFILIGASRCATTSMTRLLRAHPDIFVTVPKELFFFSHNGNFEKGWSSYSKFFDGSEGFAARGEATTDYANVERYPWVPARIAQSIPDCRLIFMVRNPLDRIESQWQLLRSLHNENIDLPAAIANHPELIQMSSYNRTLDAYLEFFDRSQLLIIFFEEFVRAPAAQARLCYAHLGADPRADIPGADRAPGSSLTLRRQGRFVQALRKQKLLMRLSRELIPWPILERLRWVTSRPLSASRSWDRPSLEFVLECIGDDTERFLQRAGKPKDYWHLKWPLSEKQPPDQIGHESV